MKGFVWPPFCNSGKAILVKIHFTSDYNQVNQSCFGFCTESRLLRLHFWRKYIIFEVKIYWVIVTGIEFLQTSHKTEVKSKFL